MFKKLKNKKRKLSAWLNYKPPGALTSEGWHSFNNEFKEKAPIRYWLSDTVHDTVVLYMHKLRDVKFWFVYRTTDRYHVQTTGQEPGYRDTDEIILNINFNILKNYVEVDLAWKEMICADVDTRTWQEKYIPFYYTFKPFRNKDLGIKSLKWRSSLDDPSLPSSQQSPAEAVHSRELLALYTWWTETRPNRNKLLEEVPEYDDQGLGIMGCFNPNFDKTAKDYVASNAARDRNQAIEVSWDDDDDEMLLRLIKVRRGLWT